MGGFSFLPTERPVVLVVTREPRAVLLVPRLEEEHARRDACVDGVRSYAEYPGSAASHGVPARAPRGAGTVPAYPARRRRWALSVKSPEEIALIRESVRWGNLAHSYLQELVAPGRSEAEIWWQASSPATDAMLKALGHGRLVWGVGEPGAGAGFRGQVGKESVLPHSLTTGAVLRRGDVLVTGVGANVGGYQSELERTMFVGEPDKQSRLRSC